MADEGGEPPCLARDVCDSCGAVMDDREHACQVVVRSVARRIVGLHCDDAGDWVAELSCLHSQHVRHRPLFQLRPWVLSEVGRQSHRGTAIECTLCGRAELPVALEVVRTVGPFDEATVAAGRIPDDVVPESTWAVLTVEDGAVGLRLETEPAYAVRLGRCDNQAIPPGVGYHLTLLGPVRLMIALMAPAADVDPAGT